MDEDRDQVRLELGSAVRCSDGPCGELADIVIDPLTRRVTHLVVQGSERREEARLVPIELARAAEQGDEAIELACSVADVLACEVIRESAYLRLGELPTAGPAWDVGVEDPYALPYYESVDDFFGVGPTDTDPHAVWQFDRVPKGDVEIRRASSVWSADGHDVGHVDGFIVEDSQHIVAFVLEHGHLWGRSEVVIPITAVAGIETDRVTLTLTTDQVGELPSRRVRRRHR